MWYSNDVYNQERHRDLLREAEQRKLREQFFAGQRLTPSISLYRRWIAQISQAVSGRFVGRGLWKTAQESDSRPQRSVVS